LGVVFDGNSTDARFDLSPMSWMCWIFSFKIDCQTSQLSLLISISILSIESDGGDPAIM